MCHDDVHDNHADSVRSPDLPSSKKNTDTTTHKNQFQPIVSDVIIYQNLSFHVSQICCLLERRSTKDDFSICVGFCQLITHDCWLSIDLLEGLSRSFKRCLQEVVTFLTFLLNRQMIGSQSIGARFFLNKNKYNRLSVDVGGTVRRGDIEPDGIISTLAIVLF